jgi:hypothetical protein
MPPRRDFLFLIKPLWERVLRKNVEAPDLTTIKDFLRFHETTSKDKIKDKITSDSLSTFIGVVLRWLQPCYRH